MIEAIAGAVAAIYVYKRFAGIRNTIDGISLPKKSKFTYELVKVDVDMPALEGRYAIRRTGRGFTHDFALPLPSVAYWHNDYAAWFTSRASQFNKCLYTREEAKAIFDARFNEENFEVVR